MVLSPFWDHFWKKNAHLLPIIIFELNQYGEFKYIFIIHSVLVRFLSGLNDDPRSYHF